ncbi:HAD family hydrolase [Neptuniibacter caesariensis]|uniref:Histidinol-phosphatase n=1 Tax=Neptuniibacter caesariensis TaxID=207954 RepID=A0A7U8GR90_NEPCE|nr:HAD family hydrolase [Neptuniibacter caesariensis]EAR61107.1 HAD-superfamily subfamily IB, PSPase-like [Oceanospirillum sp. MED92] [Neptuniibacter caesariensis]
MSLAIFDLDNTLLGGDSDHAWGEFLCEKGIVDSDEYSRANDYFYEQYKNGGLDIFEFLEFALKPLAQLDREQLNELHNQFMQEKIAPIMLPKAKELLENHRKQGDYLLIITATNRFVTGPIADALGVDEIIATDPEEVDGQYTGKVAGIPCFQDGKVTRLNTWLESNEHSLEESYFYSDSHNDLPLLELVTYPVAVNPDETLEAHANEKLWPVLDLR